LQALGAGMTLLILLTAPLGWAVMQWFSEPMNRWLRGAAPAK